MGLTLITPAAAEPILLAEARTQCRVDGTDDDAFLALAIAGARAKCEGLLQRPLITRTYEQTLDEFAPEIELDATPIQSIVSVKYTNTAGAEATLDPSLYLLDTTRALTPWLLPALNTSWPDTEASVNAVRIRFVAGWGDASTDIPDDIRMWLLMTISYLYTNRDAFDASGWVAEIPGRFVDGLLDPHRFYGL